ncbi:DUF602 domain-containing protein [Sodiomyces alkalinus F11]|uniref:DUF602 domain-containing protein n=1 Tax=Sodiomyces alkalinus (strain CBS 110278 / VKM F-3762 / F11) TaxID=1314773 RepID=A0A3N2Q813_SODAK|nr:DUF602 domain-containing protein [Sodiomyces alkalinus F11]ROT42856.1 DUF602 domain-containing protein [Sodiomyces alkalinus F11]
MGNDGGSIPKRRELVKSAARALTISEMKANAHESLGHAWAHDPLTNERLDMDNIVSDWRGRLYNYETILKSLMPSDEHPSADAPHDPSTDGYAGLTFASTGIRSLRDIVKLKLTRSGDKGKDVRICPISLKELGPATKAVYLVPCGHVFAELAIREIREELCPECSEPFKSENVVPILPGDEADLKKLVRRMDDLRAAGLTHALKKDKSAGKKKRKAKDNAEGENGKSSSAEKRQATEEAVKSAKKEAPSRTSGINNPLAASLTAKVMAEQEEISKRRKLVARA